MPPSKRVTQEDYMLKKYGILSLLVVAALLVIPLIASAQSEKSEPRLVHVTFNSRPDWAEVRVDGAFVGTTPLPYKLTAGVHKIEMQRRSYQSWSRDLTVSSETPTNVTALLDEREAKPCPPVR
jgi:hypothetical protein